MPAWRSGSRSASRRSSPTLAAVAPPRVLLGRASTRRKTSTHPNSSNTRVSHARSCGRKPEFFRFDRQFFRSISRCAMLTSPQTITSRPAAVASLRSRSSCGKKHRGSGTSTPAGAARPSRTGSTPTPRDVAELGLHVAALAVELGHAEAGDCAQRLLLRVQRGAAVALLLRAMEVAVQVVGEAPSMRNVGLVRLDLLQADHVGVGLRQPAEQPLGAGGADAVDVEGQDANTRHHANAD